MDISTLVGMFGRVGLNTNFRKKVRMFCCPCQSEGTHSEVAYMRRMTGAGTYYRERQRVWVQSTECREEMALGLLVVHL